MTILRGRDMAAGASGSPRLLLPKLPWEQNYRLKCHFLPRQMSGASIHEQAAWPLAANGVVAGEAGGSGFEPDQ